MARDEQMNVNDEAWYDEGTLVDWEGHQKLLIKYEQRAAVQREVGRRWSRECELVKEQKEWIRDESGIEEHWGRTEKRWSNSIVRWLHYPHSDNLLKTAKQIRLGKEFTEEAEKNEEMK